MLINTTRGGKINMKNYAANEVRDIVILGHSGCGKTTLSEALLYYSGAIKRFGKVS